MASANGLRGRCHPASRDTCGRGGEAGARRKVPDGACIVSAVTPPRALGITLSAPFPRAACHWL